jgi:glycerol-3-phosphate O-acyltransferase / dihydroxyacetone phosphate acyltransferase
MPVKGSPTPWSYVLIRYAPVLAFILVFLKFPFFSLLFRFVLKIFYGTIVIENVDLIPETGRPWSVDIQTIASSPWLTMIL